MYINQCSYKVIEGSGSNFYIQMAQLALLIFNIFLLISQNTIEGSYHRNQHVRPYKSDGRHYMGTGQTWGRPIKPPFTPPPEVWPTTEPNIELGVDSK